MVSVKLDRRSRSHHHPGKKGPSSLSSPSSSLSSSPPSSSAMLSLHAGAVVPTTPHDKNHNASRRGGCLCRTAKTRYAPPPWSVRALCFVAVVAVPCLVLSLNYYVAIVRSMTGGTGSHNNHDDAAIALAVYSAAVASAHQGRKHSVHETSAAVTTAREKAAAAVRQGVIAGVTPVGGSSVNAAAANKPVVVAYAVSVTGCGRRSNVDGGAILKHSIHRASARAGNNISKYDYKLFAIYHPDAERCAKPLEALGYELLKRDVFLNVSDIEGEYLRERIESNGCCGEKELIKLEAYTLTDYPIFVHLDLDVIVLKPMDEIFDMMLLEDDGAPAATSAAFMWPEKGAPDKINAFFTYDYNVVLPWKMKKPVQGGFLVARPDRQVYEEFRDIVREGDFRPKTGWGGQVGPFHGSMTFQGLIPYYYDVLHPGQSVELNRCIYNQMCDNPRIRRTVNDVVSGPCRTGQEECEDCRSRPLEDVVTAHFTLCQKPWWCLPRAEDRIQDRLCRKLHHEWFRIRSELERSWGRPGFGPAEGPESEQFFGYCSHVNGTKFRYHDIEQPYGPIQTSPGDQQ